MEKQKATSLLKEIDDRIAVIVEEEVHDNPTLENVREALKRVSEEECPDADVLEEDELTDLDKSVLGLTDEHAEALAWACKNRLFSRGPDIHEDDYEGELHDISRWKQIFICRIRECGNETVLYKDEQLFTHFPRD